MGFFDDDIEEDGVKEGGGGEYKAFEYNAQVIIPKGLRIKSGRIRHAAAITLIRCSTPAAESPLQAAIERRTKAMAKRHQLK